MNEKRDKLPDLSHLQFAVLEVLGGKEKSGKDIRAGLADIDIKKSGPAFYQMMARMEEAKFLRGAYFQQVVDGQIIKERRYRITGLGIDALNKAKRFYHGRTVLAILQTSN